MTELTELIQGAARGDTNAERSLFDEVYSQLREMASRQLFKAYVQKDATLSPTALVGELYLKLVAPTLPSLKNRNHFFAVSASAMRQVIVDSFRAKTTQKRSADLAPFLEDQITDGAASQDRVLEINEALVALEKDHPRAAAVFECKYFAGYPTKQTADALGISVRACERLWQEAKAFVREQI